MSYAETLGTILERLGAQADGEIAGAQTAATLAQSQLAVLQTEYATLAANEVVLQQANDSLTAQHSADQSIITNQALTIETQASRIKRQANRIADLEAQLAEPAAVTLFGAKPDPSTEAEYTLSEARAGVPYVHNHYATTWPQAVTLVNACKGPVCRVTVADVSASLATVQAAVSAFPDRPIILGRKHEPEDDIEAGLFTLAQFRTSQVECGAAVDAANVGRLHHIDFGVSLMGPYTFSPASGRNPDDYFVAGVHKYVGGDPYTEFINKADELSVTPDQLLGGTARYAHAKGVKPAIFEWGIHADDKQPGDRARLIRAVNEYARANGFAWVLYWDHGTCYLRNDDEFKAAGGL